MKCDYCGTEYEVPDGHKHDHPPPTPKPSRTVHAVWPVVATDLAVPMSDDTRLTSRLRRQLRQQVLSEEHECWLCCEPVDKTLHCHNPMAAEIDEVNPRSKGGNPLDRANLRLAHRTCNIERSNAPPPIANQSRRW